MEVRELVVDEESKFSLCAPCANRQGEDVSVRLVSSRSCFICRGLASRVEPVGRQVLREVKDYQFSTFSIGMVLPPGVQEREDQLRSDLRIRGRVTIKSELSQKIASLLSSRMRKKVDRLNPDLTVLVNLDAGNISVTSKSVYVYGRYTKPRGLAQRRVLCEICKGEGCDNCDEGYQRGPSVEAVVGKRLQKMMRAPRVRFTWLGSEDQDSVVFAPGRPFMAEVRAPRNRQIPTRLFLKSGYGMIRVTGLRTLLGKPSSVPRFTFKTRAFVECNDSIDKATLSLGRMKNSTIQYRNSKGKIVYKKVYWLRTVGARGRRLCVEIKLDGGLPVKRVIDGDSVSPSLSELLKTPLSCQRFDILKVWESGEFEFGKV